MPPPPCRRLPASLFSIYGTLNVIGGSGGGSAELLCGHGAELLYQRNLVMTGGAERRPPGDNAFTDRQ